MVSVTALSPLTDGNRRLQYSLSTKRAIVSEAFATNGGTGSSPRSQVIQVAKLHGVRPNQIDRWSKSFASVDKTLVSEFAAKANLKTNYYEDDDDQIVDLTLDTASTCEESDGSGLTEAGGGYNGIVDVYTYDHNNRLHKKEKCIVNKVKTRLPGGG